MEQNLKIFKSLFKGREDAFAIRWEENGKGRYTPAYQLNWDEFRLYKAKGGTLKDFKNKKYAPLTDERIINHLAGKEIIGIYPPLPDNSSWFIAADFDQSTSKTKRWIDECQAFILECEKYNLPVYLERSRSGIGGHVWMFFEEPYPAYKSRKIFIHLLKSSGVMSEADTNSNFDNSSSSSCNALLPIFLTINFIIRSFIHFLNSSPDWPWPPLYFGSSLSAA